MAAWFLVAALVLTLTAAFAPRSPADAAVAPSPVTAPATTTTTATATGSTSPLAGPWGRYLTRTDEPYAAYLNATGSRDSPISVWFSGGTAAPVPTEAASRATPSQMVATLPNRSDNQPITGLSAYIPAMCTLIAMPTTVRVAPWWPMWTGVITITPTYSGCPAMDRITSDVKEALLGAGFTDSTVELVLHPAWSTDWMTEHGRDQLRDYGIAPPARRSDDGGNRVVRLTLTMPEAIACPQCSSTNTRKLSHFGSTSCKSLHNCLDCLEPFDYFKVH